MTFNFYKTSLLFTALLSVNVAQAAEIKLAVASNFVQPAKDIVAEFEKDSGHTVSMTPGATGKFYAQIVNGAPFDILLAADDETPARLEKEARAVTGTRFTYATGRLVLWSPKADFVDDVGQLLKSGKFTYLAISNPKVAPYGLAAVQTMQRMGVLSALEPKVVQGENIAQTYQFVVTGNAQLGFVALSQVFQHGKLKSGSGWIVPENLHDKLRQDVILLNAGKGSAAATAFMAFMKSEKAKKIIISYGYQL